MGMFDTFVGTVKCPKCGKDINIEFQTKNYECLLHTFDIGSCIDKANENYFYELKDWGGFPVCDSCKKEIPIYAVIKNGRLVSYVAGIEDIDDINIMDIEYNTKIAEVIELIKKHIQECKDEIYKDANMYSDHITKEIHDNKYERVIDELAGLLDEVKNL